MPTVFSPTPHVLYTDKFTDEIFSHIVRHWVQFPDDSGLQHAATAMSLALFGQARRTDGALERAQKSYTQSIIQTRLEIEIASSADIDRLLLTVMCLIRFEV